jgi:AraC-like DNA-binding protein
LAAKVEKPSSLRFASDAHPLKDRVAFWREVVGREYLRLDFVPFGDGPVRATAEIDALGPVHLYLSETTPGAAVRTKDLARDGNGDFRLVYTGGTAFQCSAGGIVEDIPASGAALVPSSVPNTVFYPVASRIIGMRIKREALTALVDRLDERPVIHLAKSLPLNLLKGYIKQLNQEEQAGPPVVTHKVGQQLVELAALALSPARDTEAQLAGTVQDVSVRHIHRLFEQTGKTFSEFVLEERLKRVYRLLTDPALRAKRISDIAAEGGFGDLSTFNRAFRRRFGDAPRGVR